MASRRAPANLRSSAERLCCLLVAAAAACGSCLVYPQLSGPQACAFTLVRCAGWKFHQRRASWIGLSEHEQYLCPCQLARQRVDAAAAAPPAARAWHIASCMGRDVWVRSLRLFCVMVGLLQSASRQLALIDSSNGMVLLTPAGATASRCSCCGSASGFQLACRQLQSLSAEQTKC